MEHLADEKQNNDDYKYCNTLSDQTNRSYRSTWNLFVQFCSSRSVNSLAAPGEIIAAFISNLADIGKSPGTITKSLSAIYHCKKVSGYPISTDTMLYIASVVEGITRKAVVLQKNKRNIATISPEMLKKMVDTLGNTMVDKRDKAFLLVSFAGMFHRSEIAALRHEDIFNTEGGLILRVKHLRVNKEYEKFLEQTDSPYCPVHALLEWILIANIKEGPVFRSIKYGRVSNNSIEPSSLPIIVKRIAKLAGFNPSLVSTNSLREGAILTAIENGISPLIIAAQSGDQYINTIYRKKKKSTKNLINPIRGAL